MKICTFLAIFLLIINQVDGGVLKEMDDNANIEKLCDNFSSRVQRLGIRYATNKYKLKIVSTTFSMPENKINYVGAAFSTNSEKTEDEIRRIIVDIAQYYKELLSNPDSKACLFEFPVDIKRVEIDILNYTNMGKYALHPKISSCTLMNGKLYFSYKSLRKNEKYGWEVPYTVEERIETFEEAIQIIEQQDSNNHR